MDVILSISFKMTAEIEIRKLKVMFCVLFRGGVVSALYLMFFHCHEMRLQLHCFFTVSSLVSITLNFIRLLRVVFSIG